MKPRPVDVRHEGHWVPGWLLATRRVGDPWRGLVRYRVGLFTWYHWRDEVELRPARFAEPPDATPTSPTP